MRAQILLWCLGLMSVCAFGQSDPALSGPITRFVSTSDFDVSGWPVRTDSKTEFALTYPDGSQELTRQPKRIYLGEQATVYGSREKKSNVFLAHTIKLLLPGQYSQAGTAVIEAVTHTPLTEVHADGQLILIGPATVTKYTSPLSPGSMEVDSIITYAGSLGADGAVVAKTATFSRNTVSDETMKVRAAWEGDPETVPSDSRQPGVSKLFRGLDASYFPPHHDAAMLERVRSIGEKLTPEYQKKLPSDDRTRIDFRFYLVDSPKARGVYPLPSGIILVPYQIVDKLQNDSQIAAVLADAMARLLERQPIPLPQTNQQLAAGAAFEAASFIPFVGLGVSALGVGETISSVKQAHRNTEQRAAVSLAMMHTAGYDLAEAPKAWWILSAKNASDLTKSKMPEMSVDEYEIITEREAGEDKALVGHSPSATE